MKSDGLFKKNFTAEHAEIAEISLIFFSANSAVN